MNFRPFPPPPAPEMLRKGSLDPEDFLKAVSRDAGDVVDKLSDDVASALRDVLRDMSKSGGIDVQRAGRILAIALDGVAEGLVNSGVPGGPALAPDIVRGAIGKAVDSLVEEGSLSPADANTVKSLADAVARRLRERINDIAGGVIRNIDVTEMSDEDFRKLMDMLAERDLKEKEGPGLGSGGGLLSELWAKLLVDPRTRAYIRSRIRNLRTAAYYREMRWPKGKVLEPRETFRKYVRTGIPFPPVYKTVVVRPKTREDVVFFVDVSGSMSPVYPVIYAVMKAMEDLGLNVRMYVGDTEVAYVHDVDRVLEEVGGGGTLIGEGANRIFSELGSTLRDTSFIVYTDLEFFEEDFNVFVDALEKIRSVGSKVSVWVHDCDAVRPAVNVLERAGFHVVCDVKSLSDIVEALNEMRRELIK